MFDLVQNRFTVFLSKGFYISTIQFFFFRRLASGNLLLVKNGPIDLRLPSRSHLTALLSTDDGRTWGPGLLLDERSGVSYPDGFQAPDGTIHILYDFNRTTDAEILLVRFREEDFARPNKVSRGDTGKTIRRTLVNKARAPRKLPSSIAPDPK